MGAFDGVRILDFTEGTAGPYAVMLLADHGADVIKVEPPSGDRARGTPGFHVFNRNKRSLVLDLDTWDGLRRARELAAEADVLVHDWNPGRAEALGLDWPTLNALNPGLLYAEIPPFASKGPFSQIEGDPALVAGVSGITAAQWSYSGDPVHLTTPLAAYATAILAAAAIGASLCERQRSGLGQRVEISGLGGCLSFASGSAMRGEGMARYMGITDPKGALSTYSLYRAADGEWFFIGALTHPFMTKLFLALGLEELLADPRYENGPLAIGSQEDRDYLRSRIEEIVATQPRQHWLDLLKEADVPRAPVTTREEFMGLDQTRHNEMRIEVEDPEAGKLVMPGVAFKLSDTPGAVRTPAPLLGSTPDATFGPRQELPAARASQRLSGISLTSNTPLTGVVVLDLAAFIAGTYCPMVLSDFGATVIKVEPLDGDPFRPFGFGFLGWNRGKRSLSIDLKSAAGLETFYEMVRQADVVVDNYRAGVAQRLKVDFESLSKVNPRIICASVTAYGPTGPLADNPGYDPLMQARSGLMRAQGGDGEEPVYYQVAVCDYASAIMTAYGVTAALHARERTGRGQKVETCLANNAMSVQMAEFVTYEGRPPQERGGRDLLGQSPLRRLYSCADGWISVSTRLPDAWHRICLSVGERQWVGRFSCEEVAAGGVDHESAALIAEAMAALPREEAFFRLLKAGVSCAPVLRPDELIEHPAFVANDLFWPTEHPAWGKVTQTGQTVKWERTPSAPQRVAPVLGQHSVEVLREFGFSEAHISRLLEEKSVNQAEG